MNLMTESSMEGVEMATWVVAKIKTMYFENKTRKESLSTWTLRQG